MWFFDLKYSKKLFWYIQISSWLIFTLLTLLIYHEKTFDNWFNFFFHLVEYFIGFIGCLFLRYFLKYAVKKSLSLPALSLIIVAGSLICAHFWLLATNYTGAVLAIGSFDLKYIFNMTFSGYAFRLFWITLIYCGWGALYFFIKTWLNLQNQTEQNLKAHSLVKEAQLQMLRYQLNPHFLFNSLNSISVLIDEDKDKAKEMVADLSEFLRYSLVSRNYSDVPLIKEISAIKRYLDIEKKRYEEKLQIEYDIEENAGEFAVPSFLIHPLVENAIKYGMRTSPMPLRIKISASLKNDGLIISVMNTGSWIDINEKQHMENSTGTGLENIKKRLDNAYPNSYNFDIFKEIDHVVSVIQLRKPVI